MHYPFSGSESATYRRRVSTASGHCRLRAAALAVSLLHVQSQRHVLQYKSCIGMCPPLTETCKATVRHAFDGWWASFDAQLQRGIFAGRRRSAAQLGPARRHPGRRSGGAVRCFRPAGAAGCAAPGPAAAGSRKRGRRCCQPDRTECKAVWNSLCVSALLASAPAATVVDAGVASSTEQNVGRHRALSHLPASMPAGGIGGLAKDNVSGVLSHRLLLH